MTDCIGRNACARCALSAWAAANDIVNGTSATTFAPNSPITREQMAAILYRYAAYKGYDVSQKADLSGYTDAASISGYAKDALAWANAQKLITWARVALPWGFRVVSVTPVMSFWALAQAKASLA